MRQLNCKHCDSEVTENETSCNGCGMPLAPNHGKLSQRKFILFFIMVVVFSFAMMLLLPQWD